ncbi:kinase-like protein [Hymenopellis radicata]|nr:kinase-like protein [Hymenopellis radicata]
MLRRTLGDEHADIRWNEIDGEQSSVVVQNKSKYGTFINDYRIDAGGSQVLFEGDVISFGSMLRNSMTRCILRSGFIFRSFTTPSIGLFAEYDLISGISITWRATVMRAVERETCLFVAVKMLHYQGSDREIDSVLPAWKHTDILASLKHPNICSFKKMFKQRNGGRCNLGLIKELEEGKDVRAYMRKPRSLSEDIAQHFAYQLCDAFAFCHSKNFAHRNLTPQNILLTLDEPPQIKITDFGLEIPVTDRVCLFDSQRLSCLAPELVTQDGIAAHGNLVDAWSIGAIVFHMLTNASPFDDGTRHADIDTWNANIEERIHTGQICWSVLREKELSPNAEDFIRRFLETDPADRMTCEVALVHPWLLTYRVIYDHCDFPDYQPPSARCNREVVQRDLSMMSADSLSDSDASGSHGANVSAPIQRRIDEDKEVADVGLSPDLIANFERLTNQSANEEVAPVNVNENEKCR